MVQIYPLQSFDCVIKFVENASELFSVDYYLLKKLSFHNLTTFANFSETRV